MKTKIFALGCLLAFSLVAAEPSKPTAFEIRLVLDKAAADSEPLIRAHPGTAAGNAVEERLHVQKQPLLDRSSIKTAVAAKNPLTGDSEVELTFTAPGAKRFAQVTRDHVGERLAIVVDGKVRSAPRVAAEIAGGKAQISGSFSEQEAAALAARLNGPVGR